MPSYRRHAHGFTLIELSISIALGLVVVYTAMAGFRVATQSMTIANRLSLENSLMRAGLAEAHQQLDFWTNLDDPLDQTAGHERQQLRASGVSLDGTSGSSQFSGVPYAGSSVGMPFATMKDVFPTVGTVRTPNDPAGMQVIGPAQQNDDSWEADNSFAFNYAWAPHDPRTWFRGNVIEKYRPNLVNITKLDSTKVPAYQFAEQKLPPLWFGRYSLFTNTNVNPTHRTFTGIAPKRDAADTDNYDVSYVAARCQHRWYANQMTGLSRALGFYGLCDYLPSNALFGLYTSQNDNRTNAGGLANALLREGAGYTFAGQGMGPTTLGGYALTNAQSYGIISPAGRVISPTDLANEHYRYFKTDYPVSWQGQASELQYFINVTMPMQRLMGQSPAHWPVVSVGVGHFLKSGHFVNIAKIRWMSPLTSEIAELSFTGVGSTLRGARMQRRPGYGAGWAAWDNGGSTNDSHLDSPQ